MFLHAGLRGGGSWPPIIFYTDALGLREELRDMVRRLATVGYTVLLLDVSPSRRAS
jgi:dienelactone hydrolase